MIKEWKGTSLMILEGLGTGILGMFFWVLLAPTEWYGEGFFVFTFLAVWVVVMILSMFFYLEHQIFTAKSDQIACYG